MTVTPDAIRKAHKAMEGAVLRTPSVYSPTLSSMTDADIWLKLENQQITSSFKPRGAFTRMSALTQDEAKRGVISMSAGRVPNL